MEASTQTGSGGSSESAQTPRKSSPVATALKWIGGVAAVISLLLGLNQFTGVLQTFRVHHKEFTEAMKAGELEQERGDYPAAFDSFKHAVELDPVDRDAQKHQAQAAMLWLENVQTRERSFTDTANLVLPVLDKSLSTAKGQYAADLLAHIGWANFLKSRDGSGSPETIAKSYQEAVKLDPNNPYANAMWATLDSVAERRSQQGEGAFRCRPGERARAPVRARAATRRVPERSQPGERCGVASRLQ